MAIRAHEYPKPLWNNSGGPIELDKELGEKLRQTHFEPGGILSCPNGQILDQLRTMKVGNMPVWSEQAVKSKFPMALHGPTINGKPQCISVKDKAEMDRAIKNGWSVKPPVEEEAVDAPLGPDSAPRQMVDA
jgi:hypothetical protein